MKLYKKFLWIFPLLFLFSIVQLSAQTENKKEVNVKSPQVNSDDSAKKSTQETDKVVVATDVDGDGVIDNPVPAKEAKTYVRDRSTNGTASDNSAKKAPQKKATAIVVLDADQDGQIDNPIAAPTPKTYVRDRATNGEKGSSAKETSQPEVVTIVTDADGDGQIDNPIPSTKEAKKYIRDRSNSGDSNANSSPQGINNN